MKPITFLSVSAVLFLFLSLATQAQKRDVTETEIRGHTMYTLGPPGMIPAIFEPEFVSVRTADSLYYHDEPLIVVLDGSSAKGYSTWHLDRHEIVNDYVGNSAIAVTW